MSKYLPSFTVNHKDYGLTVSVIDEGPIVRVTVDGCGQVEMVWNKETIACIQAVVDADAKMAEEFGQ